VKHLILSSLYNFDSGYKVILDYLLNGCLDNFILNKRCYSEISKEYEKYFEDFFIDCEGNQRKFGPADIVGCFLLTHCAKKYPFILISPKFMFAGIKYVTEHWHKDFKNDIICSYIYNHDEKMIEGLL